MSLVGWRWFRPEEFTCKCGCQKNLMDPKFVEKLDGLRDRLGFPLVVNSGYRCPDYNAKISRTGRDGPHTTGRAVDIKVYGSRAFLLVDDAMLAGLTGVGLKQHGPHEERFVHLDDLTNGTRPWVWTYT